jgi:MFS transporter, DHA1 family, multidrug resistance protein
MFRFGLFVQLVMGIWLVVVCLLGLPFWAMVMGVAGYVGVIAMVTSNAMAVIMDDFPHMAGTAASLAGTIRFGTGALVGAILAMAPGKSAWPMVSSMALCSIVAVLFYLYASRPRHKASPEKP